MGAKCFLQRPVKSPTTPYMFIRVRDVDFDFQIIMEAVYQRLKLSVRVNLHGVVASIIVVPQHHIQHLENVVFLPS